VASGLPKFTSLEAAEIILNPEKEIDILDLPDLSHDNIRVEVENCIAGLASKDMDVIVVNTIHPQLEIPAFYTVIPGAHFRERALGTSVGMFTAKLIAEDENPMAAIKNLEEFERDLPGQYYTMFYLGNCHLSLGNLDTALTCFKKSLALGPTEQDIPSICAYMGICLNDMGKYREALEVLGQGEAYDAERTEIYNLMGFCHFKLKEHESAIDCFKKVLALNPSSAIDYANIASNYRDMGHTAKAIQYYETALSIDPGIDFARDSLSKLQRDILEH
jgi:ribosomal protein S12 methylthiotransferase accessory factor